MRTLKKSILDHWFFSGIFFFKKISSIVVAKITSFYIIFYFTVHRRCIWAREQKNTSEHWGISYKRTYQKSKITIQSKHYTNMTPTTKLDCNSILDTGFVAGSNPPLSWTKSLGTEDRLRQHYWRLTRGWNWGRQKTSFLAPPFIHMSIQNFSSFGVTDLRTITKPWWDLDFSV